MKATEFIAQLESLVQKAAAIGITDLEMSSNVLEPCLHLAESAKISSAKIVIPMLVTHRSNPMEDAMNRQNVSSL